MTKTELFIKLAQPDANGVSRWVSAIEFVGEYADLKFGNGASWARKESTLAKKYKQRRHTVENSPQTNSILGFVRSLHPPVVIKMQIRIYFS